MSGDRFGAEQWAQLLLEDWVKLQLHGPDGEWEGQATPACMHVCMHVYVGGGPMMQGRAPLSCVPWQVQAEHIALCATALCATALCAGRAMSPTLCAMALCAVRCAWYWCLIPGRLRNRHRSGRGGGGGKARQCTATQP